MAQIPKSEAVLSLLSCPIKGKLLCADVTRFPNVIVLAELTVLLPTASRDAGILLPNPTNPALVILTCSAAASDCPVLKTNEVAFEVAQKSPSDTASMPAAASTASDPAASSGA